MRDLCVCVCYNQSLCAKSSYLQVLLHSGDAQETPDNSQSAHTAFRARNHAGVAGLVFSRPTCHNWPCGSYHANPTTTNDQNSAPITCTNVPRHQDRADRDRATNNNVTGVPGASPSPPPPLPPANNDDDNSDNSEVDRGRGGLGEHALGE